VFSTALPALSFMHSMLDTRQTAMVQPVSRPLAPYLAQYGVVIHFTGAKCGRTPSLLQGVVVDGWPVSLPFQ
jgi:hypothetical protein